MLVVVALQIEPYFGRPTEIPLESQGGVHGEGAFTLHDFVDAAGRHANLFRHAVFRKPQRN